MARMRIFIFCVVVAALSGIGGCVSCIPQYTAPPKAPVSACYPVGHDPYIPMDHNPSPFNPWDFFASLAAPVMYGPPR
jgi:hypothetical protein